jgi:2-polyprenyl-6-methoxyphenol hydroxylase-like FAD-dependent oxidoreductase
MTRPVLIVGGGLGGVATALGLGQQGRSVRLLEQSAEIAPIGYGVQIGPNVLPVLERLGVGDEVRRAAYLPDDLLLLDASTGEQLVRVPLKDEAFERRYPAPYIAIHRVDLHEILLKAVRRLPGVNLNQATTVTSYTQTADAVQVQTEAGESIEGCALIAADGLRSRLRSQMHPNDASRDTGYVAHRTIVSMREAPASLQRRAGVTMWTGDGFHVIYYPLRERTEMNIVAVFRVPAGLEPTDNDGYRNYISDTVAATRPEVRDVISVVNLERRWAIADRDPLRRWSDGRVTLLGDSAHATLQSLAQGAGMALEDASALTALMAKDPEDPKRAFATFERQRFVRTARVQLESRALWHTYHCGGVEAEVRTLQLQERTTDDLYRCFDWLWNPAAIRDTTA